MKTSSLKDIAEALGVSKALVSLVLNGKADERGINKETQLKVKEKAKELNYIPNQYARGLRIGKSNTLGLIVPDISNVFYGKLCKAIEMKASELGYDLIISNSYEDSEREIMLINKLLSKNIEGLIIASSLENEKELEFLTNRKFPFVLIDRVFDDFNVDSVSVSNFEGSSKGIKHLKSIGKNKIACITISPVYISSVAERIKGYISELDNKEDALLIQVPHYNIETGIENAIQQIESKEIDAVFCVNNNLTKAMLRALNKKGIQPNYKILSFDDLEVFDFAHPRVSTIAQPIEKIGEKSISLLVNHIKQKDSHIPQKIILDTGLIIR
ncbi:MAG TPA: LacI family transcriptional regulator [Crocinitomix sp.]|nr:LacI family transcriptional regulator [Crocinitomix sp.]